MKKPLVVLTGPTAVGKTDLSIQLAKRINGAILSADSMQVYKYMDIGSAKVRPEEMQGIKHYLIDEFMPDEEFHVVRFQEYARRYLENIYRQGQIPIVVGGTGFYIQALLYDIDFTEQACDSQYRKQLEALAREKGSAYLHQLLMRRDPKAAEQIHPNNTKRIIRALEFYEESGGSLISEHNERERQKESPYQFAYFVLTDDRATLYQRIDARVDAMLSAGLIEEVRQLAGRGYTKEMVSMQGLGYKEILRYLEGELTLDETVYIIKRDTRHFAKRQLTWFKRERDVVWLDKREFDEDNNRILDSMLETLKNKNIICS